MQVYKPTGRVTLKVFLLAPLLVAVLIGVGWLYQKLVDWIPFIYLNFLLTAGIGLVILTGMALVMNLGNCRNRTVGVILGLLTGSLVVVATHYFQYQFRLEDAGASDAMSFSTYLGERVHAGWSFSIRRTGGGELTGAFVWVFWGIEALAMVGAGVFGGLMGGSRPYCERCREWPDEEVGTILVAAPDPSLEAYIREAGTADDLFNLPMPQNYGRDEESLVYQLSVCPKCKETAFLDVSLLTTQDAEDEPDTTIFWEHVALEPRHIAEFANLEHRLSSIDLNRGTSDKASDAAEDEAKTHPSELSEPDERDPDDSFEPQKPEDAPAGFFERLDAHVYGFEHGIVTGSLLVMTFSYFFMIVHRQMANPVNALDELFLRWNGYTDEASAPQALLENITGLVTPLVFGIGVTLLAFLGLWTRWRTMAAEGDREPWLRWLILSPVITGVVYGLMWGIGATPSRWVVLFALAVIVCPGLAYAKNRREWGMLAGVVFGGTCVMWFFTSEVEAAYTWSSDLSLILLFYVGFLGASMATRDGRQIKIDALRKRIKPERLNLYNAVSGFATVGFTFFLFLLAIYDFWPPLEKFIAYKSGDSDVSYGGYLEGTEIPIFVIVLPILLGLLMMALRFGRRAFRDLAAYRRGELPAESLPEIH